MPLPFLSPGQPVVLAFPVMGTEDQQNEQTANPPTAPQVAAFTFLLESGKHIREVMLSTIQQYVPEWQGKASGEFAPMVELTTVILLITALDGISYVGCEWAGMEFEHGIGILLHRDRVAFVGMAEEVGDERIARRDVRRQKNNGGQQDT